MSLPIILNRREGAGVGQGLAELRQGEECAGVEDDDGFVAEGGQATGARLHLQDRVCGFRRVVGLMVSDRQVVRPWNKWFLGEVSWFFVVDL